jgi:hypothetical protein
MQTVDFALERAPEHAWSHANQGWNCLHRNDPKRAQDHFREALRLDPDFEYARQGMLEALKARNPVYRGMLAYFLWMGRLSTKLQWVFIIGTMFGVRAVRTAAEQNPQLGVVLWPLVVLFYVFIYLSWVAGPMFNLLLRFDRFGRLVLSRDERKATNWFGACVFLTVSGLAWWASGNLLGMFVAIVSAILSVCVAITFNRQEKKRGSFAIATVLMAAIGFGGVALMLSGNDDGFTWLMTFFVGFLGMQLAANVAASR